MNLSEASVVPTLPVVDLDRAKAFYSQKLGLKELPSKDPTGIYFEAGNGTKVFLYKRGATKADNTAFSFDVEDVEGTVKELKEKGVVFETYNYPELKTDEKNIATMGDLKVAWFKDSEGNIIAVGNG